MYQTNHTGDRKINVQFHQSGVSISALSHPKSLPYQVVGKVIKSKDGEPAIAFSSWKDGFFGTKNSDEGIYFRNGIKLGFMQRLGI